MMKRTFLFSTLFIATIALHGQTFEVPVNYTMKTKADYVRYQQDVVSCFDFLMATPSNEEMDKRMDAGGFMMRWFSGSPYLNIEMNPKIVNFTEVNPDLALIFMGGWMKQVVTTGDSSVVNGNLKGLESVIQYYQKNRDKLEKDAHVEKYIKMKEKGELEAFIKKNVE